MKILKCRLMMGFWAAAMLAGLCFSTTAGAAIDFVSGLQIGDNLTSVAGNGDPTRVAVSLANGFPVWYEGGNGLQLELCLDRQVELPGGVVIAPCDVAAPLTGAPVSFPGNFGAEAMYWSAVSFGTFDSSDLSQNLALLVLTQQAGFANEGAAADGSQAVFTRIRLRIDLPVAGTYRVTHPFGTFDYVVTIPGRRAINQTQDLGILTAQDFLVSMRDQAGFVVPNPFDPAVTPATGGVVNSDGVTVGPFLVPAGAFDPVTLTGGPVVGLNGATYIGLPFAPNPANPAIPLEIFQPATAGLNGVDYFEIELTDPPFGFTLDSGAIDGIADNIVRLTNFQLLGKVFNGGPNISPVAEASIVVGTAMGSSRSIDVFPNGTALLDPVDANNVHGINPQAIAVADPVTGGPTLNANGMPIITAEVPTEQGGTVRRVIPFQSGQAEFLYTPPTGFTGVDTFDYVVQDTGGLISQPATVTVIVEDIQVERADFRVRTGKYRISGTSSETLNNSMNLFGEPRTVLTPEAAGQIPPVLTSSEGSVAMRLAEDAIEFLVQAELASAATRITVNVGAPGENGPSIFTLYEGLFGLPFISPLSGTLRDFNLQPRPEVGISSFADAIDAILRGDVYVVVTTVDLPAGDIRGQLVAPPIGSAPVVDGSWRFNGSTTFWPGPLPGVIVESANGVRTLGDPLRTR